MAPRRGQAGRRPTARMGQGAVAGTRRRSTPGTRAACHGRLRGRWRAVRSLGRAARCSPRGSSARRVWEDQPPPARSGPGLSAAASVCPEPRPGGPVRWGPSGLRPRPLPRGALPGGWRRRRASRVRQGQRRPPPLSRSWDGGRSRCGRRGGRPPDAPGRRAPGTPCTPHPPRTGRGLHARRATPPRHQATTDQHTLVSPVFLCELQELQPPRSPQGLILLATPPTLPRQRKTTHARHAAPPRRRVTARL